MTGQRLYPREASIIVSDTRFDSDRIDVLGVVTPGFRLAFEVVQSNDSEANKASAVIHNLSETSRQKFSASKRQQFRIEAGYQRLVGTLFDGEAVHVSSTRVPGGFETKVSAQDGLQAKRAILSAAFGPRAGVGQIIQKIASAMGVNATRAVKKAIAGDFDGAIGTFFNGYSFSGSADRAMDDLAKSAGFEWSILNGELQITTPDGFIEEEAIVLSPTTGLIGSPERRYDEKAKREIVVARCMLNARINPKRKLQLESNEISGLFKVQTARHTGDTHGADWISECEASEVKL